MAKASSANIAASVRQRLRTMQDRIMPRAVNIAVVELEAAITATFDRRQTGVPIDKPPGLTDKFTGDPVKQTQWAAYSESTDISGLSLADVAADIWERLEPICNRRREGA